MKYIELLVRPSVVKVTCDLDIGELVLPPCSTRLVSTKDKHSWFMGKFNTGTDALVKMYMGPMFTPPLTKDGQPSKTPWVVPFFVVSSDKAGPWNMEVRNIEVDGVKVPVLTNHKTLVAGATLKYNTAQFEQFETSRSKLNESNQFEHNAARPAKRQK